MDATFLDLDLIKLQKHFDGGVFVTATVNDYNVEALVFAHHADNPDWELNQSRISKLRIKSGRTFLFNWDRGLDVAPANTEIQAIVDFLCEGLAGLIFQN